MILEMAAAVLLAGAAAESTTTSGAAVATSVLASVVTDSTGRAVLELPEVRIEVPRWLDHALPVPFAGTVLDREQIEASGAVHLGELLEPVVGVRVTTTGGLGSFTPVSIRGSSNDQVLVLVDGRRMNAAQGGGADLAQIPLANVERVEVMRGGGSALYGADAVGGVVNLVTRDVGDNADYSLRTEFGSFDTAILTGHLADGRSSPAVSLDGRLVTSDGPPPFTSDVPGYDDAYGRGELRSGWVSGKGTFHPQGISAIDVALSYDRSRQGVPGSIEFPTPSAEQRDEFTSAAVDLTGLLPGGAPGALSFLSGADRTTSLGAFAQRRYRRYTEPDAPLGAVDDSHKNVSFGGQLEHRRDFGGAGLLTLSADWRQERLESTTDGDHDRDIGGISARQAIDVAKTISLTPALRYDILSDFDDRLSPKLFGTWAVSSSTTVRASAGLSYRPPAFDDLFYPPRASAAGNPDLRPETSRDADLGIAWTHGETSLGLTGFANRITDLIQWQPGAAGIWRPHNVDGARILGLEAEAKGAVALGSTTHLGLEGNVAFLDPRETGSEPNTSGKVLIYRPRWKANAIARLPLGRFTTETTWSWTGPVYTTRANTKQLDGYLLGDVALRWQASSIAGFEARVLNLTDEIYEDYRGYPVPGREWRLAAVIGRKS